MIESTHRQHPMACYNEKSQKHTFPIHESTNILILERTPEKKDSAST